MITLLENVLERSDGNYISAEDLEKLDQSIVSWQSRRETYNLLQAKENAIISQVLTQFQSQNSQLAQKMGNELMEKCQRDLTLVLRHCAMAMLLQDKALLEERLLFWMQNIMRALRRQKICDRLYSLLEQVLPEHLPPENVHLLLPYVKTAHEYIAN